MSTIAWKGPTTPLPMEINPRVVFERMFGRPGTPEDRLARMRADQSILDSVRQDIASLKRDLDARDRGRLNDYLEHVREVESRIERAERQAREDVRAPEAPVGVPVSFEEHVTVMFELMAVAYEADLTRVFTFMMNREASQVVFRTSASTNRGTTSRITATRRKSWRRSSRSTPGRSSCSAGSSIVCIRRPTAMARCSIIR